MVDLVPDLIEFSTVILAPGIQPASVDAGDLPLLGDVATAASIRTPVLTAYRFPAHLVQIEDPKVQFTAPEPTDESIERMEAAARAFVDDFIGRKGVLALGHNVKFRRRHPQGTEPEPFFKSLMASQVFTAVVSTRPIEVGLDLNFWPAWCTSGKVRIEPSRVDDLKAVFFSFNFHFELAGENVKKQLDEAIETSDVVLEQADSVCNALLSVVQE